MRRPKSKRLKKKLTERGKFDAERCEVGRNQRPDSLGGTSKSSHSKHAFATKWYHMRRFTITHHVTVLSPLSSHSIPRTKMPGGETHFAHRVRKYRPSQILRQRQRLERPPKRMLGLIIKDDLALAGYLGYKSVAGLNQLRFLSPVLDLFVDMMRQHGSASCDLALKLIEEIRTCRYRKDTARTVFRRVMLQNEPVNSWSSIIVPGRITDNEFSKAQSYGFFLVRALSQLYEVFGIDFEGHEHIRDPLWNERIPKLSEELPTSRHHLESFERYFSERAQHRMVPAIDFTGLEPWFLEFEESEGTTPFDVMIKISLLFPNLEYTTRPSVWLHRFGNALSLRVEEHWREESQRKRPNLSTNPDYAPGEIEAARVGDVEGGRRQISRLLVFGGAPVFRYCFM